MTTRRHTRPWIAADVPGQHGRTAVVTGATGATSGIGVETARILAERGAQVVLACRDVARADQIAERFMAQTPASRVRVVPLDLASLDSVRAATAEIRSCCPRLDLLIGGVIDFDDLQSERRYRPTQAYWQSKLANLLFCGELQGRLAAAGAATASLAAHPGIVCTELYRHGSRLERLVLSPRLRPVNFWLAHGAVAGALPTLRAATDPAARGGEYYGPAGLREYTGGAVRVTARPHAHDAAAQGRLWQLSEELTGVTYRLPVPTGTADSA
jgi:NAD(P)-dependent dehydrogenase (short-subunit alcohol dehydrogenase family)